MTDKILTIRGLPTHNEFIKANNRAANNRNCFDGAKMKRDATAVCAWEAKAQLKPISGICEYMFIWYEPNKKRDPDNISFAKKFIFDGMVTAGIISNDGWANVGGFIDRFVLDRGCKTAYVEVLIHKREE
jgi:hypothetical protein